MFYVYILISQKNNNLYIGSSNDLKRRFAEHNNGLNRSTKAYRPWELLYYEAHHNKLDAKRRESYLKTNQGAQALRRMIRNELTSRRKRG